MELTQNQINLLNLAVIAKITEMNKAISNPEIKPSVKDIKEDIRNDYRDLLTLLPEMK